MPALFGPSVFSGAGVVRYAESDLCDSEEDVQEWAPPFILMVDRGQCTFARKVWNAQSIGALAVVIADNSCLCDAGDSCQGPGHCEEKQPIMADDGSGKDIYIPSFLLFKQDADLIKKELQANGNVVMELTLGEMKAEQANNGPSGTGTMTYLPPSQPTPPAAESTFNSNTSGQGLSNKPSSAPTTESTEAMADTFISGTPALFPHVFPLVLSAFGSLFFE